MRPTRATALLTAGLVTLLGAPAAAAAAPGPSTLFVNNQDNAHCSDTGPGTQSAPFCTISAAARLVVPGQTVRIKPGRPYYEALTVERSGEPGKPVSFVSDGPAGSNPWWVDPEKGLTVKGASHVVVRGAALGGAARVLGSSDVELDRISMVPGGGSLVVGEGSQDVRVSRSTLYGARVEGGSARTVLSHNMIYGEKAAAVAAVDAPGTVVTNNTVFLSCVAAVSLTGGSAGSALFNNVIAERVSSPCTTPGQRSGVSVAQSATAGTRVDYNLIAGNGRADYTTYHWAGTAHADRDAFHAATGQGARDIVLASDEKAESLAVDSADATAPGVLPTDSRGYPVVDDLRVPNTGKDGGYLDRGAREGQNWLTSMTVDLDQPWAPAGTPVKATATAVSAWAGPLTYTYDFGDGSAPVTTTERTATHAYGSPCACTVQVSARNEAGHSVSAQQTAKAAAPGPLTAAFTTQPYLPTAENPKAYVLPLTVELDPRTTAAPWPVRQMDVDFGDGTKETFSALEPVRHTYGRPGDHKVTVTLKDTRGATSTTTGTARAAYTPAGYVPVFPQRILDTRTAGAPVQAGTATPLTVPVHYYSSGPSHTAGASAVVLNVTVTGTTQDTHLNVWPAGQPRPATSNVNVRAGGTSSNTVTVPVGADGKVSAQLNSGQGHLVVDFVGYYQPHAGERFTPVTPRRAADTRTAGGPLGGGQTRTVKVAGVGTVPPDAAAVALNLTSTGTTTDTHVIAYPDPNRRPVSSNLNPEPGKDKSNQVIVPVAPDGTITLYNNAGSTHLVVDTVGYYGSVGAGYFVPATPQRLADTRTTGKLAAGATTTIPGLPADAIGAALNVTATDTTTAGFLTVHGFGTARTDASSLNTRPGETVPNHVITPVGEGKVNVWNSWGGPNHVITDLLGYFVRG
ncbi:PKD domain-containing protein [Streptomyces sp. NPDC047014]|uniref:PKD domain-containing protein n=1 Tax=Streptomyces sp. NPDC047014 TaxID=3155736 RepID=UPI0033E98E14